MGIAQTPHSKLLCRFNALDLATGAHKAGSPTAPVAASRTFPNGPLPNNATTFVAIKQHQRPGTLPRHATCFQASSAASAAAGTVGPWPRACRSSGALLPSALKHECL